MRKFLLLLFVFSISLTLFAGNVNPEKASNIAKNFYLQMCKDKGVTNVTVTLAYNLTTEDVSNFKGLYGQKTSILYVFNVNQNDGFVIVSADDAVSPILGYSQTGSYVEQNAPKAFLKLIEKYKKEIIYVITNQISPDSEISQKWERLLNNEPLNLNKEINSVNPLLTTTWSQSPYYNDLCPSGSVTGCAATAMAQIMKFWDYPTTGTSFHSYNEDDYGTLSANFASTTYNWSSMPNNVSSSNSAVATLMYHCGVAIEMNYSPQVSGAWVIEQNSPVCVESALKAYFGYSYSMHGEMRSGYSDATWIQMLKSDLNAGKPVQYAGWGQGGHTFVCDGYDNNDFFHMNWGWGGYCDGFFDLEALNPGSGGTGSGAGTYNNDQQALFGIQPNTPPTDNINAYSVITVNPNPIMYSQAFTVNADIINSTSNTFNGDYTAAIFDIEGNFVDYVQTFPGQSLAAGYHYTGGITFSTTGMASLTPGNYTIGIYFRPTGGNWSIIGAGSYSNFTNITVVGPANNIQLYNVMSVSTDPIYVNQAFVVTTDIVNYDAAVFNGTLSVDLYSLDGTWIQVIQEYTGVSLPSGQYFNDITFSSTGLNVAPGNYYLVAWDKPDGGNWEIVSSVNYPNPISITVAVQPITPDIYEVNNTENTGYNLLLSFSGGTATVNTVGSNIHNSGDFDYYQIYLPWGFNYTINARIHDSYNSGNGQTYTDDVMFTYKNGTTWSETYDDVMPSTISVSNGGTIIFSVSPYFIGEMGTYLLDMTVTQTVGIDENEEIANAINLYPNPAQNSITLDLRNFNQKSSTVRIIDNIGQEIYNYNLSDFSEKTYIIPLNNLSEGLYFINIISDNKVYSKKFTIQK